MTTILFVEDFYLQFYQSIDSLDLLPKERQACENFYRLAANNLPFTQKQAKYLEYILKKYIPNEFTKLESINYKNPFRILDNTKKVWIEQDSNFRKTFCFKFPYSFLKTFDEEMPKNNQDYTLGSSWDHENSCRRVDAYKLNFLNVIDFVEKHNFIKDETFIEFANHLDDALVYQESFVPKSTVDDGIVTLIGASEATIDFFERNKTSDVLHDLFFAKIMGYPFDNQLKSKNYFDILVSSRHQFFWLKELEKFFSVVCNTNSKTGIILDRSEHDYKWLRTFIKTAKDLKINKKITVCFRENSKENEDFNQWVKENDLGGKVENGDILIFQHKPPKWIFKNLTEFKIMATNMINPSSNVLTQDFLNGFPCVFYLSDVSPTKWRNKKIVSL